MWLKFHKTLVIMYADHVTKFFTFVLFIPVFGISTIIHQQLVAMLRKHVRFDYKTLVLKKKTKSEK